MGTNGNRRHVAARHSADWTIPQHWHRYGEQDHAMRDCCSRVLPPADLVQALLIRYDPSAGRL